MPYTLEELPESGILVMTSTGRVDDEETRKAVADVMAHGERTGSSHLLSDVTGAEIAITLPSTYNTARAKVAASAKAALVQALLFRPDQREFAAFWENTNVNAGMTARAFTDRAAAIAWLEEQQRAG